MNSVPGETGVIKIEESGIISGETQKKERRLDDMQKSSYHIGDPKGEGLIEEIVRYCSPDGCEDLLREIMTTVVKLGLEHRDKGDYKLINTTLKELRHAMRIFVPYRNNLKTVIFGSARTGAQDPCYKMAASLAEGLAQNGFMVISGAGGGIMEAANEGAGKKNSFGINIKLPFEQRANPVIMGDPKLMTFKYFFTRKLFFIKESNATVLFPGGFGTQDEGNENLTLFQTGKCMPRPIVLMEPENGNYWKLWLKYVQEALLDKGYISPEDMHLFYMSNSVDDAISHIVRYYRIYHSLRYIKDVTILRLKRAVPKDLLERLNEEYGDILCKGKIEISAPLNEELFDSDSLGLHRLIFYFNRQNFGRLNMMIQTINDYFDRS